MVIAIVFWFICAFVAAAVASSKGANAGLGFLAGLLLGPLGIVLAFVMGGKKCPECRGNIIPGATRCKNCGVILATASGPEVEPVAPPKSDQERHREMLAKFHAQRRGEKGKV
jgi:hypothetical protein